jgi:hypothetical protein
MKTFKDFIAEAKGSHVGPMRGYKDKGEPWVLVQNRKEVKRFKRQQDAKMTSSRGQELMSLTHAKKMGIKLKEAQ